ncbi:hypothetical protein ABH917_000726 [Thermobifida halotolerans]
MGRRKPGEEGLPGVWATGRRAPAVARHGSPSPVARDGRFAALPERLAPVRLPGGPRSATDY